MLSNEIEAGSRSKEEAILSKVAFSQKKMEIELIQDGLSLAMGKAAAFNLSQMNFLILAQVILLRKT